MKPFQYQKEAKVFSLYENVSAQVQQQIMSHLYFSDRNIDYFESQENYDLQNIQKLQPKFYFNKLLPLIQKWKYCHFIIYGWKKDLKFKLRQNTQPKIPKMIQHINFSQVYYLKLTQNQIVSIQPLALMMFEKLNQVQLQKNKITSFKPFAKAKIPYLQFLYVHDNKFTGHQYFHLTRARFRVNYFNLELDICQIVYKPQKRMNKYVDVGCSTFKIEKHISNNNFPHRNVFQKNISKPTVIRKFGMNSY